MGKMFDMLDEALSETYEYVRGNVKLPSKVVFIPDAPKPLIAVNARLDADNVRMDGMYTMFYDLLKEVKKKA